MIQKHTPSPAPYYITGIFFFLYCLLFPLYLLLHFILAATLAAAVFLISRKVFPGVTTEYTAPSNTGNEVFDERIDGLAEGLKTLKTLRGQMENVSVISKIEELEKISEQILGILKKEPEKTRQMQTFFTYYLPTTLDLLRSYCDLTAQKVASENLMQSISDIEHALETIVNVFAKELDGLYLGKAIDISAEIKILQQLAGQ